MTVGKTIKVVLTLDDAGFSSKTKQAREVVKTLNTGIQEIDRTTERFETGVAALTKGINSLAPALTGVGKKITSFEQELGNTIERLTGIGQKARTANEELNQLGGASSTASNALGMVGRQAAAAGVSIAQMKPSLAAAAAGYRELDKAAADNAKSMKASATAAIDARLKTLQNEVKANAETIATRERMYSQLLKAENDFNARAMAASIAADNIRRTKKAGSAQAANVQQGEADRLSTSAATIRAELNALDALLPRMRDENQQRLKGIELAEAERKAILAGVEAKKAAQSVADYVGRKNAEEIERITKGRARAERDAYRDTNQAARESAEQQRRYMREVAAEAEAHARAIAGIWRGMAGMWAASKVERGLGASVGAADQFERASVGVKALNMGKEEEKAFFASSAAMSKELQFLSYLDAVKSRMSAIASIGYNNTDIIDKTLATAVKAANNLQYLGYAHGDMQSMIRNMYGVVEMRQQTADAGATNRTFETVQKIISGTAGKVQTQDLETVLRRLGAGASQLSDKGLVNVAAIIDQFKVAGGDSGGSGGGVSTVGTMLKMFQSYAMGKTLSQEAIKQFSGAGILEEGGLDFSKDYAGAFKSAKHAGLKDADLWMKDPVAAMQKIMPAIVAYTQAHRKEFYQDRDMANPENQLNAVTKYMQRLGITQTAIAGFITAADPRSQHRIEKQAETIENSKGIDGVNGDISKTFGRNVEVLKTNLANIGRLVGDQLLPPLNSLLTTINSISGSFRDFAQNNPAEVQFLAISAAVGGLALGASALTGLLGMGGLTGVVASLGATAATAFPTLMAGFAWVTSGMTAGLGAFIAFAIKWVGGIAFAGLLGWAIGTWLKDVKVGVLSIQQWFENGFLNIEMTVKRALLSIQEAYYKFLGIIGMKGSRAEGDSIAGLARTAAEREKLAAIEKLTRNDSSGPLRPGYADPRVKAMSDSIAAETERRQMAAVKAVDESHGPKATVPGFTPGKLGAGAPARPDRPDRTDPLTKALGEALGKVNSQKLQLQALKIGAETVNDLAAEAAAEVEGKRQAGDYNKDHDQNKPVAKDDPRIKQLVERLTLQKLQAEQIKALTFGNERLVAATLEADDAMNRLAGDSSGKMTDSFRALERELVRAESRLGAGAQQFDRWRLAKNLALFERSRADLGNFAADMVDSNKAEIAQFLPTERERKTAELDASEKKQRDGAKVRYDTMVKTRDNSIAELQETLANDQATGAERVRLAKETADRIAKVNEEFRASERTFEAEQTRALEVQANKRARALEEPIEALARQWKDSNKNIEDVQTRWADGFINMLTSNLGKGRMQIGDFVRGVMLDIVNAKLKEVLADPMKDVISAGTNWLKQNLMGPMGGKAEGEGMATEKTVLDAMAREATKAGGALSAMATGGVADAAAATAQQAVNAIKSTGVTDFFSSAIQQATLALEQFIMTLSQGGTGSSGGGLMGMFGSMFGGGTQGVWAGSSNYSALSSMGNMGAASIMSGFANGGIMTEFGPAALRKYANGGIANSPQLALYGEGSMNEAYVPLPDGRTIPVTMQGGAPNVIVNVINQSGQPVNAEQGQPRMDGRQMILDVVLSAANQPGTFRNGMKGALK